MAVAGAAMALVILLDVCIVLIGATSAWIPDYAVAPSAMTCLGLPFLIALLSAAGPLLMLRSIRNVADDPQRIEAAVSSLPVFAAVLALTPACLGFVASFVFRDFHIVLAVSVVVLAGVSLWWPTGKRLARWETVLRSRGSIRSLEQALQPDASASVH